VEGVSVEKRRLPLTTILLWIARAVSLVHMIVMYACHLRARDHANLVQGNA